MNGYISLKIGKKTIGFKFGLWVLDKMQQSLKVSITDIYEKEPGVFASRFDEKMQENLISSTVELLYLGAKWDAIRNGRAFEYTIEDAYAWLDEIGMNSDGHKSILMAFTESLTKDVPVSDTKKKKQPVSL